jgi:acyl-CoA synthetase (AMP-forming)/AMP-acid ligase II
MDSRSWRRRSSPSARRDKLGEEVAAAVVLREGKTTATEQEICARLLLLKLNDLKVLKKILIMDEIPKGNGQTGMYWLGAKIRLLGLTPKGLHQKRRTKNAQRQHNFLSR